MQILRKRLIRPRAATGMKEKEGVWKCSAARGDEASAMMTNRENATVFVDVAQVLWGQRGEDKWTDGKLNADVAWQRLLGALMVVGLFWYCGQVNFVPCQRHGDTMMLVGRVGRVWEWSARINKVSYSLQVTCVLLYIFCELRREVSFLVGTVNLPVSVAGWVQSLNVWNIVH